MAFLSIEPLLEDLGNVDLRNIDWVIVGGESGPGARPVARMGAGHPRPVPPVGRAIFLQTVGRRAQERDRAEA